MGQRKKNAAKRRAASRARSTPGRAVLKPKQSLKIERNRTHVPPASPDLTPPVVIAGIGASAGSLMPIRTMLSSLAIGHGLAIVVVQHMRSESDGLLISLLKDQTPLEVLEAADGLLVAADHVYVMPPDKTLSIIEGKLSLRDVSQCQGLRMPIDHFFCTLATDAGRRAIGVVLSGTGMDGTAGLAEINALGGAAVVQEPATAEFPEMPRNAVDSNHVDAKLPPDKISDFLVHRADELAALNSQQQEEAGLEAVLAAVRNATGHDFHCYKQGTLERRVRRRMALRRFGSYDEYARLLRIDSAEAAAMRKDLLIGVTEFFRQSDAWRVLEEKVIAELVAAAKPQATLRIWVPACASGKEAYSLAILLAESIEKSGKKLSLQLFATDADAMAIEQARAGQYCEEELKGISQSRVRRFFVRRNGRYEVIKPLREMMVFAPQDLTADPPFSKLDLVSCRNLLIYLDQTVQRKIIQLFHFALREDGCLFLGSAENISGQENLFEPVSQKWRIYRKLGLTTPGSLDLPLRPSSRPALTLPAAAGPRVTLPALANQAIAEVFGPSAAVVIDRKGTLLYVHGDAQDYLEVSSGEQTGLLADAARDGLRNRLASAVLQAVGENKKVTVQGRVKKDRKSVAIKVTVRPLRHPREAEGLLLVTFEPQRLPKAALTAADSAAVHTSSRQLEDELRITREELSSTIEQLEQSNEHLKASNEEVMSANEELQSANEELETSKEELHSLNEELNAVNQRLQEKVAELEQASDDVANLLTSGNVATIFLDRDLRVRRFTPAITRLLNLIEGDIGRPIADIVRKFKDSALLDDAKGVLVSLTPAVAEVQADDGSWFQRRILPYRTKEDRIEGVVITFTDVTELTDLTECLRATEEQARWLGRLPAENPNPVLRVSADGTLLYQNPAAEGLSSWRCTMGEPVPREALRRLVGQAMAVGKGLEEELELGDRWYAVAVAPVVAECYANIYGRDITERKAAEQAMRQSEARFRLSMEATSDGLWDWDAQTNEVYYSPSYYRILGYEPGGFPGTLDAWKQRVHPEDLDHVMHVNMECVAGRTEGFEVEYRMKARDGQWRWILGRGKAVTRDNAGRAVRLAGTHVDITDRKKAEQALHQLNAELEQRVALRTADVAAALEKVQAERKRFLDVLETLPVIIEIIRPDYRVVWENRACREALGENEGKLCHAAQFGNDKPCKECQAFVPLQTGKPHHWQWTLPDGRTFDIYNFPFADSDGSAMILEMDIDITQQRQAEVALREAIAYNRSLIEASPDPLVTIGRDGRITDVNIATEQATGRGRGELVGTDFCDYFTQPDQARDGYQQVFREGAVRDYPLELRHRDGQTMPVLYNASLYRDAEGKPIGVFAAARDVTGARQAEAAVKAERQRLYDVLETLPVYVILLSEDYRVPFANKFFEERFGKSQGRRCYEHLFGRNEPCENCETYKVMKTGQPHHWYWTGPDKRDYDIYDFPFTDTDGSRMILEMGIDITEVNKAHKALKEAKETLEQRVAERTEELAAANDGLAETANELARSNEELQQFAYVASHDLQEPLRMINGFLKLLEERYRSQLDDKAREYIGYSVEGATRMSQLISDLLDYSRLTTKGRELQPIGADRPFNGALANLRGSIQEAAASVTHDELPSVIGDHVQLMQLFQNLISNAIKFRSNDRPCRIHVGVRRRGNMWEFSVADNGIGIPKDSFDRIFVIFQRLHTREKYAGTGIGLAICKKIVERHGGRIWVESTPGEGSSFHFTLSAHEG